MTFQDNDFFNTLIAHLGQNLNLGDLDPDKEGLARLVVDEVPLTIICQNGGLMFYSAVGRLPQTSFRATQVREQLLLANSLFQGTGGATLGVSPEATVSLCYQLPLHNIDIEQVTAVLNDFVNVAEFWLKKMEEIQAIEEAEADFWLDLEDQSSQTEKVSPNFERLGSGSWLKL